MQIFASIDPELAAEALSYEPETGLLFWKARPRERFATDHHWRSRNTRYAGKEAGHRHTCTVGKTYIQVRVDNVLHYAHRIGWVLAHGPIPAGMQVDHIDGDGTNNRLSNLRLVTASGNKRNQRRLVNNTSGFTGVYHDPRRGTFTARAWVDGKFLMLGTAKTAEAAYELRQAFNRENGFHENHGTERPL